MFFKNQTRAFPKKQGASLRIILLGALLSFAALICFQRFRLESDLLAFLPSNEQAAELEVSRNLMRGPLKSALILNVVPKTSADAEAAREVARGLAASLAKVDALEKISAGPDPGFEKSVFNLYFPRRFLFTPPAESSASFWEPQNLEQRLNATKSFLSSPAASVYRSLLPQDPLLLFHDRLKELSALQPKGLTLEQGQFVGPDGVAFIFARTRSDLSFEQKSHLLDTIQRTFAEYRKGDALQLEMCGALPFEVEGEQATRVDLSRVSAISFAAMILLSWLFFRGILPLLLIFLPIFSGTLVACAATLLSFGEIHGLTLAFGSALLGVGMDYPLHLFNDQAFHQDSARRAVDRIRRGLYVGCGTTLAGFLAFGATSSPALLQVAVFTATGLLTSLLVTLWVLPSLSVNVGDGKVQRQLVAIGENFTTFLAGHRRTLILCLTSTFALALGAIILAPWDTSTEALNPASLALRQADARVRERLGLPEEIIVVQGKSPEETLFRNHQLSLKLRNLKQEGRIDSFASLSALYLPDALQRENGRTAASPSAQQGLKSALERAEFSEQTFAPAFVDMSTSAESLSLGELQKGPLADIVGTFWMDFGGNSVALTRVIGPRDTIKTLATSEPGAFRYNPTEFIQTALTTLTRSLRTVLLIGGGLMLVIVLLRHHRLRPSAVAFTPAALAALSSLAIHGTFFGPLHLFHVLASLIVLSMGIDYGAFLVEAKDGESLPWPGLVSAALSTMASFGTLALSSVPALNALGGVIFVGISLTLLMTLIFFTFLTRTPPGASSPSASSQPPRGTQAKLSTFVAGIALLALITGCSSGAEPPRSAVANSERSAPGGLSSEQIKAALLSPEELPRIFWHQRLTIQFAENEYKLSAVIQNDGREFQVLALGPANTRLFLITQREKSVGLKVFVDRQVNLDPALLVLDIQRALFWFPEKPSVTGRTTSLVRGFCAQDLWTERGIKERKIADLPQSCEEGLANEEDGLTIRYEPAYMPKETPNRVILNHRRRAYSILVEHLSSQESPP